MLVSCSGGAINSSDNRVQLTLAEFTNKFNKKLNTNYRTLDQWKEDGITVDEGNLTYKIYCSDICDKNNDYVVGLASVYINEDEKVSTFWLDIYVDSIHYLDIYMIPAMQILDKQMKNEDDCKKVLEELDIYNKNRQKENGYKKEVDNKKLVYFRHSYVNNQIKYHTMQVGVRQYL